MGVPPELSWQNADNDGSVARRRRRLVRFKVSGVSGFQPTSPYPLPPPPFGGGGGLGKLVNKFTV